MKPIIVGRDQVGNLTIVGNEGAWDGREIVTASNGVGYHILATDRVESNEVLADFPSYRHASEALSCVRDEVETLSQLKTVLGECSEVAWAETNQQVVYILHFDRPYKHARHYVGCTNQLPIRIRQHRTGYGSVLTNTIRQHGIGFSVADVFPGDVEDEMRIKHSWRMTPRLCPICKES